VIPADLLGTVLDEARELSDSSMLDTCIVTRPGEGLGELDEATGLRAAVAPETVYAGQCELKPIGETVEAQNRDDTSTIRARYRLKVPSAAGPFARGDVVQLTALHDSAMASTGLTERSWRVGGVPTNTWRTDQRLVLEEVTFSG
jgi:hypothetical protein